jgi:pimeloyl-ACP methyl ester carboxylesterase
MEASWILTLAVRRRSQVSWDTDDVVINDATLRTYRRGHGVTLVLAHGAMDSALRWNRVAEVLESEFEVITYDARCHGESQSISYGIGDSGDDLIGLTEALELDRPFTWGHSMGAMASALALARRPELFRGGILEDPGWGLRFQVAEDGSEDREAMNTMFLELAERFHAKSLEQIMTEIDPNECLRTDVRLAAATAKHEFRPVGDWSGARHAQNPWPEMCSRFRTPVLLLCGNPDKGAIVTPEISTEAAKICSTLEVARFDASHGISEEAFDDVMQEVLDFVRSNV